MLRELLAAGRADEVISLVGQLVARNAELEMRLAKLLVRGKKSEKVSRAQLLLFLDAMTDGLPLHRRKESFRRLGLNLSVATLADQVQWDTDLLWPLWRAALAEVIAAEVMHLDGTGLPVWIATRPTASGLRLCGATSA